MSSLLKLFKVRFLQSTVSSLGKSVAAALIGEFIMEKFTRLKMSKEELQEYMIFKRRGSRIEAKKGKGAKYKRSRDLKDFN